MSNFDLIETLNAQPGEIIRIAPRIFILVVSKKHLSNSDFYYVRCNSKGEVFKESWDSPESDYSAANYIRHSNMLGVHRTDLMFEKVGLVPLKTCVVFNNCKRYQWFLTGDKKIDSYLSNLDARWTLFSDAATDEELRAYAKDEDRNYHSENGSKVEAFSFFMLLRKQRDANLMRIRRQLQRGLK